MSLEGKSPDSYLFFKIFFIFQAQGEANICFLLYVKSASNCEYSFFTLC